MQGVEEIEVRPFSSREEYELMLDYFYKADDPFASVEFTIEASRCGDRICAQICVLLLRALQSAKTRLRTLGRESCSQSSVRETRLRVGEAVQDDSRCHCVRARRESL